MTAAAVAGGIWVTRDWTDSPAEAAAATGTGPSVETPAGTTPGTTDAAFPEGAVPESELPDPEEVATDEPVPAPPADDVPVLITYAGWDAASSTVEVSGIVSAVVGSATCTVTLTRGEFDVTASGPATPDVTTTACGSILLAGDDLAAGTWSAVLSFASADASGASEPVEVRIP